MAAKYDRETEAEVRSWFKSLLNEEVQPGMRQVEDHLRNGQLLCRSVELSSLALVLHSACYIVIVI